MKAFLKKSLVYAAVFLLLSLLLQFVVDRGLQRTTKGIYNKWNFIAQGDIPVNTVFIGSSRMERHVHITAFDSITGSTAMILGVGGAGVRLQEIIWSEYLKKNKVPSVVFFELDAPRLLRENFINEEQQYLPIFHHQNVWPSFVAIDKTYYAHLVWPLYKYHAYPDLFLQGIRSNLSASKVVKFSSLGFEPLANDIYKEKKMVDTTVFSQQELQQGLKVLQGRIDFVKQNGGLVYLINTPSLSRTNYVNENAQSASYFIDSFTKKNRTVFFNYSDSRSFQDSTLFYDADHLNDKGAKLFTELFAQDFKNYINKQ